MGNRNTNLQTAKNNPDDEFYTVLTTINSELVYYRKHFAEKTVLCNCDNPFQSDFCRYFLKNFNILRLHRLICTAYDPEHGYVLDVTRFSDKTDEISDADIARVLQQTRRLNGNGDFRSPECVRYLEESDIVVTNGPFSLFRDMVSLILDHHKEFLLIGNQNALTYKEIFPLVRDNKVWTGYHFGEMKFRVPEDSAPHRTRYWVDQDKQKWRSLGNAMWLTNLDIEKRHEILPMVSKYDPALYPKYDTFDAINVKKITEIPYDYAGIMGVPITILSRYNSDQFEIVGEANHGSDNEYDLFKPTINGRLLFKRILIRNRNPK